MTYVDLNPVRAGIAPTPEQSSFTSIQIRIKAALNGEQPKNLLPFTGNEHQEKSASISFCLKDYLTLVDESWLKLTTNFEGIFTGAVDTAEHLCEFTEHVGLKRTHGITNAQSCLNNA
tara:strand:- start:173 stop:526 length:354 start_codon:yes stop_codon:yes gene_type:complete